MEQWNANWHVDDNEDSDKERDEDSHEQSEEEGYEDSLPLMIWHFFPEVQHFAGNLPEKTPLVPGFWVPRLLLLYCREVFIFHTFKGNTFRHIFVVKVVYELMIEGDMLGNLYNKIDNYFDNNIFPWE